MKTFQGDNTDVTALVKYAQDLEAENERLRAENEKLRSIVDAIKLLQKHALEHDLVLAPIKRDAPAME